MDQLAIFNEMGCHFFPYPTNLMHLAPFGEIGYVIPII